MGTLIETFINEYKPKSKTEYRNALQEIMQYLTLVGLWRSKFFDHAAFYGETCLRIFYELNRFSEDLDFSLLHKNPAFDLEPYLKFIEKELEISGLSVNVEHKIKRQTDSTRSAFIKTGTLETFIRIGLSDDLRKHTQSNESIKIKLEIDIDPPEGFSTEVKYLLNPIPFSTRTYGLPDLFARKMHAVLCRPYKIRVKGRDWYDLIWYVRGGYQLNLNHLEIRLRQSGHYSLKEPLSKEGFIAILKEKIASLNIEAAKDDIKRFISDERELEIWSKEFFLDLASKICYLPEF